MNRPHTLPIRLHPIPGEALHSWLTALAHRLHTPLGVLLPELGLPHRTPDGQGHAPTDWTVLLRPPEIAAMSAATGVAPVIVEAMTLSRYDGIALRIDTATRQVNRRCLWGRATGSRFCPDCLAESGGRWQLSWRLGWSFACTIHRRLLADVCPGCGRIPHRHPLSDVSHPGRCVEPAGPHALGVKPARCGTDLSTADTPTFQPDHPVLAAQQLVGAIIADGTARFGVYANNPVPTATALTDLRAVAARVLRHADRQDLNRLPADLVAAYDHAQSQPTGYRRPASTPRVGLAAPTHAAVTAVGVTAATLILTCGTLRDAGTALHWLVKASRRHGLDVTPSTLGINWRGTSTTLKAVHIAAVGPLLQPSDQLRYRILADTPHHRLPDPRAGWRHHRVPAMFWTTWALRLQPDPHLSLRALRPALSGALLLAGTHRSLPQAAEALDALNAVAVAGEISRVLRRLEAHPCWPHILTALIRLADHLDTGGAPIDYHRRRHLDYRDLLPTDQWRHICRRTGFHAGRHTRIRFARCLLFEKISGMPAHQAPASFAVDNCETRIHYLRFAARLIPDVATHLEEAAQDFLARHGIDDEPVQWEPPASLLDDLALPGDDPSRIDLKALHRLVHDGHGPSDTAQRLATTLDVVRHLLDQHPAPAPPRTDTQARAAGQPLLQARTALPIDLLTHLYLDQQLALHTIGNRIGVSGQTIGHLLDEYGITRQGFRSTSGIVISRDWLHDRYVDQRRSLSDLARETGMSQSNMKRWAKTHNIPLRPPGNASHPAVLASIADAATAPPVLRPALTGPHAWNRLHRFAEVTRHPTIRAAAKALGLHASALKTQISRLERDLGGQLLTRARRGHPMRLTPLGRKVITATHRRTCEESATNLRQIVTSTAPATGRRTPPGAG